MPTKIVMAIKQPLYVLPIEKSYRMGLLVYTNSDNTYRVSLRKDRKPYWFMGCYVTQYKAYGVPNGNTCDRT